MKINCASILVYLILIFSLSTNAQLKTQNYETAANYLLNNGGDLEEALGWIDGTIAGKIYSQKSFNNLQIKSKILDKLNRRAEVNSLMDEAMDYATIFQVHQYGRSLIANGEKDKVMAIFKMNAKIIRIPGLYITT